MTEIIVGKWGRNLAVRVPAEMAKAIGLTDGEGVEINVEGDALVIRRTVAMAEAEAEAAAAEIMKEGEKYSLGDTTIRDLIDEGRRG